jgi:hypothetical protein
MMKFYNMYRIPLPLIPSTRGGDAVFQAHLHIFILIPSREGRGDLIEEHLFESACRYPLL